ncbi:hypothetical protein MTZ49_07260 [Entomomonas sp. E2T0]|uniref:hypothetical protein n=1 Tax=Entomomonas sp. E2T0 TaxID=2930213 RepID=UPI00222810C1|nr:hypothetical protein [Entomomonas sp. E2T0]UYZ85337.1 hypothetical protein MTZ49_07260 [Entomomonas sp. E2T0]
MAVQKILTLVNGVRKLVSAITISTGAADAGKIPALDSEGKLDVSMLPDTTETPDIIMASEAISAGSFVNIFEDSGTASIRMADNSNSRPVDGFIKEAVASGETVAVYPLGTVNAALSGLTIGSRYYLGTTGQIVTTPLDPNTNDGKIHQYIGKAKSATELMTIQEDYTQL